MNWLKLTTAAFAAGAIFGAHADAPLIQDWIWVELKPGSCRVVTFEAPGGPPLFIAGDTYRTALISGIVVRSGYVLTRNSAESSAHLPPTGSALSVVTRKPEAGRCDGGYFMETRRFAYHYGCDTAPTRGACMAGLPVVEEER